uniref:Reverse transcriptase domain-containing protein n=1 Tax=Strongyloides papillosus TaxID=174720 RepID=A0A0N5B5I3_STREA
MADFVHSIEKFVPKMENATIWLQQLERAIRLDALVEDERDILLIKLDLSIIKLIEKKGLTTCQEIKQFLKDNYDGTNSTEYSLRKLITFKLNLESANALESSLDELEKLMSTAHNSLGEKALEREIHTYILKSLAHNPTLLHATGYSLNNRSIEELKTEIITAYKLSSQDKNLHCSYCKKNNHTAENCRRKNGECLRCGANDHKLKKDFRGKTPTTFQNSHLIRTKRRNSKPTVSINPTESTAFTVSTESTVSNESTAPTVPTIKCQMNEKTCNSVLDDTANKETVNVKVKKEDMYIKTDITEDHEPKYEITATNENNEHVSIDLESSSEEESIVINKPSESNEPYLAIIEHANEENGLYIVNVTIKDYHFKGLVDTGSQVSIIPKACAENITDISKLPTRVIRTASGTIEMRRIPEPVELIIANFKISVSDLLVSLNAFHGFEGILGLDILKKININITFNNKSLSFDPVVNHVKINKNNFDITTEGLDRIANRFKIAMRLKFPNLEPNSEYDVGGSINTAPTQKFVDVKPLNIKFYSCPITPDLIANINEMEHYGIIKKSKALEIQPFYSIVKKDKNNRPKTFTDQNNVVHQRVRVLFDARELNHKTVKMNYEPNTLAKIIQSLRRFTYASVIDLHQGFFQIKLNPENVESFNFKVGATTYSYARLPQGCINSPIIFQRSIELLFEEFRERSTRENFQLEIYQDDIILLTSKDVDHHLRILEDMLSILSEKDAKLSVGKSKFLRREIEYLSWKFSNDSITPSDSSISKLVNSTLPMKKKNLYSIIQAANYFHTAIPNWEKLTRPLYQLTRGNLNDKIDWNNQQHLYKDLLTALLEIPPLKMMDPSKPLILVVDASNEAVGGYLYQEEGNERSILGHFCNVLGPTIKARSPSYLELKSIAVGVDKFKNLIAGRTLYIHSDHKPLSALL